MAEVNEKVKEVQDLSGGLQRKTSRFVQKDNEASAAENVSFGEIGGFGKKLGYFQQGNNLTTTTSSSTSSSTTTTSTSSSSSTSTTSTSSSTSTSRTTSTSTTST